MRLFKLFKRGEDYKIPSSWDELTLLQFDTITEIKEQESNKVRRDIRIVSYFSGKPVSEIEALPLVKLNEITKPLEFTNTMVSDKWANDFEIDNCKFRINPDIRQITGSKFIQLSTILSAEKITPKVRAEFVAVFMESRDGKEFKDDELVNLIYNKGTVGVIFPLFVFFSRLMIESSRVIRDYSGQQLVKQMKEIAQIMEEIEREN
jgi:hypothetical protein